jgi:hypothetical protein
MESERGGAAFNIWFDGKTAPQKKTPNLKNAPEAIWNFESALVQQI